MDKRNIVVFLCDQLRPDFLNIYGCEAIPTPNIDSLAENGVVFENAITQSTVCAPARASMMTGRYVSDHQVWTNDIPFRDGMNYLAKEMNELGYKTAAFGKLHHYPAKDSKGFQYVRQFEEGRLSGDEPYLKWLREKHPEVNQIWNISNNNFLYDEDEYYEYWIASETIDFIDNHVKSKPEQPFLSWISFQGPHTPLDPPRKVNGTVNKAEIPLPIECLEGDISPVVKHRQAMYGITKEEKDNIMQMREKYAEIIVEIDKQIGRILKHLKSLGVMDKTTFLFSADHGDLLGDFGLNAKGPFPYRGQLDIPMVLSNHPDIKSGTRSESLVGNIDIPGTILDITGCKKSIGVSRSLIDQINKQSHGLREVIFSEFCDSIKTVDSRKYRFSYYPFTGFAELYDKEKDPDEQLNLAGKEEYLEIEKEMLQHIIDFNLISKGVRIEAHDFVPRQQEGLRKKYPEFEKDFLVAFPLSKNDIKRLEEAGLPTEYNEFIKGMDILAHYASPYWEETEGEMK